MASPETVVLREQYAHYDKLTINRPKSLNALNFQVLVELDQALADIERRAECRAVILCGSGDKAFVAGADISEMQGLTPMEAEAFAEFGQRVLDRIAAFPKPVIAAVDGFALGGGCELAMACDILVVGPKARFGQPEVKLGVIPGFGGTQRLVRRIGAPKALDICLTGRMIDANEAIAIGLASRLAQGSVLDEAVKVAGEIAAMGPVAVRLCKRAVVENADSDLRSALAAERTLFAACFATLDQKEGMAAFLQRRSPNFTGK